MARQQHRAAFITGAVLGGLAGAAITLWRAPQSGRETRAQIGAMVTTYAGPLAEPLAALAERLNDVGEAILERVTSMSQPKPSEPVSGSPAPAPPRPTGTEEGAAPEPGADEGSRPAVPPASLVVATGVLPAIVPQPLTEEEREALDLDPVIEPEELPQAHESDPGYPLAVVQAELLEDQRS